MDIFKKPMAINPIEIRTPRILEPKVLRGGESEIQIELDVYANYQPEPSIREEPVERVEFRLSDLETDNVIVYHHAMGRTSPLTWRGHLNFYEMYGPDGNYRIDFHAWDRGYEADTRDKAMKRFDHASSIVTLNRDRVAYDGPYFLGRWSLDPRRLGIDDSLNVQTQVNAGIWVAGFDRIYKVKASIYSWWPVHDPTMRPSFMRPPDLDQEYSLECTRGTFHRGLWEGRIEFPSYFPNGTYSVAFSAASASGLVVTTRNYPDIDRNAHVVLTGR